MKHLLLTAAVFVLLSLAMVVVASPTTTTMPLTDRIVVVHRHGARTPILNVSGVCGNQTCGQLTNSGKAMLFSLGEHIRAEYGDILPEWYDIDHSYQSTSDTILRVIQSSAALLKGLFAFNSSYTVYPAIDTQDSYKPNVIATTAGDPAFIAQYAYLEGPALEYLAQNYPSLLINSTLQYEIAEEIGIGKTACEEYGQIPCSELIWDTLLAWQSNVPNSLDQWPKAKAALPLYNALLDKIQYLLNGGYLKLTNQTADFIKYTGAPGWGLASEISGTLGAKDAKPFNEWSGHDTTVMPLYVVMGNLTFSYPVFGSAIIFEGFEGTSGGERWMRAKTGFPDQLPDGKGFPYTFSWYPLQCVKTDGTEYTAMSEGCPVEDFTRGINRYAPQPNPLGAPYYCSIDDDILASPVVNCTPSATAPKDGSLCASFRANCPFSACGANMYMKPDYSCASTSSEGEL